MEDLSGVSSEESVATSLVQQMFTRAAVHEDNMFLGILRKICSGIILSAFLCSRYLRHGLCNLYQSPKHY